MAETTSQEALLNLTAGIISAHVSHNPVTAEALPTLIRQVYDSLAQAGAAAKPEPEAERPEPAVNPKRSVFPGHIVCLEDGQKVKMLRRHLRTAHNMTPEEYRERWGLDARYPMVAPNYAATRSELAKAAGLGRKPASAMTDPADEAAESAEPGDAGRSRSRRSPRTSARSARAANS